MCSFKLGIVCIGDAFVRAKEWTAVVKVFNVIECACGALAVHFQFMLVVFASDGGISY